MRQDHYGYQGWWPILLASTLVLQGCTGAVIYAYRKNRQEMRLAEKEQRTVWWKKCEEEDDCGGIQLRQENKPTQRQENNNTGRWDHAAKGGDQPALWVREEEEPDGQEDRPAQD